MLFHGILLDKETMPPNVSLALSSKRYLVVANCHQRKEKKKTKQNKKKQIQKQKQ